MRILKGQEILPDDSTLVHQKISDGDTVNIVFEPEKEIRIAIKRKINALQDYATFKYVLKNSTPVQEIKKRLVLENDMVIPVNEFTLVLKRDGKSIPLDDSSLPLHYYGLNDGSELFIERHVISRFIENQKGHVMHIKLSVKATVGELRKRLIKRAEINGRYVDSITIFTYIGERCELTNRFTYFKTLSDDDETIGFNDIFYVIENTYSQMLDNIFFHKSVREHPLPEEGLFLDDIYAHDYDALPTSTIRLGDINDPNTIVGIEVGDTVLSVKLRGQDQLDVPVHRIQVYSTDDSTLDFEDHDVISDTNQYAIKLI